MTTATAQYTSTTVDTKSFTRELEWAARFVESKTTIPILANLAVRQRNGTLEITGTDLETTGITALNVDSDENFEITVPSRVLLKYLKKVKDESMSLTLNGQKLVIMHGGDSTLQIPAMSIESYPELPVIAGERIALAGLKAAIPRSLIAISKEDSRFTLNGSLLEIGTDGTRLVSTDGKRLSLVPIASDSREPLSVLIPHHALSELGRLNEDSVLMAHDEHHVSFETEGRTIVARKLTGNFPDYRRVMPKAEHCAAIDCQAFLKHGERVALLADERYKGITLKLDESTLTIRAETCDNGAAAAVVASTWDGDEWTGGFNWAYLSDFLKLASATVELHFSFHNHDERLRPALLTAGDWQYIVMPRRI